MWVAIMLPGTEENQMNEFKTYHPIVNFIYFAFVIGFSMFLMHPIALGISLGCSFLYSCMLQGGKGAKRNLSYMLPMLLAMALVNPLFNHEGVTILWYFPSGNPLTLESILYGVAAAGMLLSVIGWFSCYNRVMTGDKFIYLFGKMIPALSLIFSMTLRFVPRFTHQLKVVANAQRCIGKAPSGGGIIQRAKNGLNILSVMVTWSLENAIDTADSMKSRGYGLPGRTAFSIFRFDKRDQKMMVAILIFGGYTLAGHLLGAMEFTYLPFVRGGEMSLFDISVFIAYLLLCICPVIIELWEVKKWNSFRSNI